MRARSGLEHRHVGSVHATDATMALEHARELQKRQQDEFAETESALKDLEKHMVLDKAQVEELTRALAEVEPSLAKAVEAELLVHGTEL